MPVHLEEGRLDPTGLIPHLLVPPKTPPSLLPGLCLQLPTHTDLARGPLLAMSSSGPDHMGHLSAPSLELLHVFTWFLLCSGDLGGAQCLPLGNKWLQKPMRWCTTRCETTRQPADLVRRCSLCERLTSNRWGATPQGSTRLRHRLGRPLPQGEGRSGCERARQVGSRHGVPSQRRED